MAEKKKWISGAVKPANKGKFREKAERAGMSTPAYAAKEADAPGTLGKEARLAETFMGMHHGGKHERSKRARVMYDRSERK